MNLIQELKENEQDFEFYPTTTEIINYVKNDLKGQNFSLLDIGAGTGKVLDALNPSEKYAIEKSKILVGQMSKDIMIIGADFHQQALIDKDVDVIFCNPPYKEYKEWMIKIIKQSSCKNIYFVVPERWKNQKQIINAMECRTYEILGSFDFLTSEDRAARAKVDLIKCFYDKYEKKIDVFSNWFDETFKINATKTKEYDFSIGHKKRKIEINELVQSRSLIEVLVELYNKEMRKLFNNYEALQELSTDLFDELDISLSNLKKNCKMKIMNIKNNYWKELFDNLDKITDRLTYKSRRQMLEELFKNTNIDFTASNAYNIVVWVLKNANEYFDVQLKEVYLNMSNTETMSKYVSNERFKEDGWRYNSENSHYKLDYRIILSCYKTIDSYYKNKLESPCYERLQDIFTVAGNLGFNVNEFVNIDFNYGEKKEIFMDKDKLFCELKFYKNGNVHIKFCKEFMQALNIEAGRLNGWLKNEEDVKHCFNGKIKDDIIKKYFGNNLSLTNADIKLLN